MPLIETKGVASAQGFGLTLQQAPPVYIEDVFSTWLYTGNGSTQTITNGIDLSTYGGLVWSKARSSALNHFLCDTARGRQYYLITDATVAQQGPSTAGRDLSTFNSNGFSLGVGEYTDINTNAVTYASWTFRKQAKFFDVVTYTGNGSNRTVAHSLGSVPGCILVKRTDTTGAWAVYHRSLANTEYMVLNTTAAKATGATYWNSTTPTSTEFSLGTDTTVNANGGTYVAYLFAHDAGGFGLTGSDNVISCGSFTTDGSGNATVSLGYEPQLFLRKRTDSTGSWTIVDNMRGFTADGTDAFLYPNLSNAEATSGGSERLTSTGVQITGFAASMTFIYIAIRRGPMKVPTSGTSVFNPVVYTGTNVDNRLVDMSLLTDMTFARQRDSASVSGMVVGDRLRGDPYLLTGSTNAENADADSFMTPTVGYGNAFSSMVGFGVGNDATSRLNISTTTDNQIAEGFRRAPGFFDVVCFTSTGSSTQAINHNLGVAPELIIEKVRNNTSDWAVQQIPANKYGSLNSTSAMSSWSSTGISAPTATVFSPAGFPAGRTEVAYLFASCPGVSKVGSYTGTGTTLQIDCGFTGGARFVLIKRTDSTGDWYVWDSARGIVSGDDPYLLLNSTAAEVTNTDYVDTYSAGFEISSTAPAAINANGGSFIFLAIA